MGSYNGTCGITQMAILGNDPVALLFISYTKSEDYPGTDGTACESNTVWSPLNLPIYGRYNDYGGVEDITEGWNEKFFLSSLNSHQAGIKRHVINDIPGLLEIIHQDKVIVRTYGGLRPVGWMMMHRWAYDILVEAKNDEYNDCGDVGKIIEDGVDCYNKILSIIAGFTKTDEFLETTFTAVYKIKQILFEEHGNSNVRNILNNNVFYQVLDHSGSRLDGYNMPFGIESYKNLLVEAAMQQTPADDPRVLDIITEFSRYYRFFNNFGPCGLRKQFAPQSGAGSQSVAHDLWQQMIIGMTAAIDDYKKITDEWNAGDDDEG